MLEGKPDSSEEAILGDPLGCKVVEGGALGVEDGKSDGMEDGEGVEKIGGRLEESSDDDP